MYAPKNDTFNDLEFGGKSRLLITPESMRLGFIRKVYSILSVQLLMSAITAISFSFVQPIHDFVMSSPGMFTAAMILPIVFILLLFCFKNTYPINFTLLGLFTILRATLWA